MENIKDYAGNDITIYANKIDLYLHEFYSQFADEKTEEDPEKLEQLITDSTQNRYNAALMYIRQHVFTDKRSLKTVPYMVTKGTTIKTNNNEYDYDLLNDISDYYIYICSVYDKNVSLYGFSCLTGIDYNIALRWNNSEQYKVSSKGISVYQKLYAAEEQCLKGMLTGKRNPVGILGILNHTFNWSMPGVSREQVSKRPVLSAEQLPRLDNMGNMHNSTTAIEQQKNN